MIGVLREETERRDPAAAADAARPAGADRGGAGGGDADPGRDRAADATARTPRVSELSGRTAYRIVQEGLTNARKHAPGALVTVRVAVSDEGALEVELRNPQPVGAGSGRPPRRRCPAPGCGLIGLGERVALAGGELVTAPTSRRLPASGDPAGGRG